MPCNIIAQMLRFKREYRRKLTKPTIGQFTGGSGEAKKPTPLFGPPWVTNKIHFIYNIYVDYMAPKI